MINDIDISNYIDDTYDSAKLFYETDRMKDFFLNIRSAHKYLCVFGAGCWGKIFCQWCSARKINIDFFVIITLV